MLYEFFKSPEYVFFGPMANASLLFFRRAAQIARLFLSVGISSVGISSATGRWAKGPGEKYNLYNVKILRH
jgi:hypothetical protein